VSGLPLLAALLLGAAPPTPSATATAAAAGVTTAQLAAGETAKECALLDCDGDGRADLAIVGRARASGKRFVTLFRTGERGFERRQTVELPPDVSAWAVGDVHPDAGDEVVLFTARGAYAWRPAAEAADRFAKLLEAEFLWQLPEDDRAFLWDAGVADLDGDGLDDLLVPEAGAYVLAFQSRDEHGAAFHTTTLRVPEDPTAPGTWLSAAPENRGWRGSRSSGELRLTIGVDAGVDEAGSLPSTLLEVRETVPAPQLVDWDGDGDLDLLAQTARELHVWRQEPARTFAAQPSLSLPLPVPADRDRKLDASYSAHALDFSGDRRADCAILAGDRRSDSVRTQGLFFVQDPQAKGHPLFGDKGRPQDLLVFAGFVADVDFVDIDSDGLRDLVVASVRPDLLDQLRSVSSESLDADIHAYLNNGGHFSRRPDLSWRLTFKLRQFDLTARFIGDVNGDGLSELLVRDRPEHLRLLMMRRGRDGFELIDRALWELDVDPDARILLVRRQQGDPDVLILEAGQVLAVRLP